jgi:uncharacterized protein
MSLADDLMAVGARYGIAALYVFGSRAVEIACRVRRQTISPEFPESDVDIGVQPVPGQRLTAEDRVRLAEELEELLGAKRVDLVVMPEADPFLALDVIRGELLYCADPDQQAEHELYVLRRAGDLAPYARERWLLILSKTAP